MGIDSDKKDVELILHLEGKSSNSILISLDDLNSLTTGINGISKFIVKKRFGKESRNKFDKEMKEICSLGLKSVGKGSAILCLQTIPCVQQRIDPSLNPENIMQGIIETINNFESDEKNISLDLAPYFDDLTKPLDKEGVNLGITMVSLNRRISITRPLTFRSREKVQAILERRRLKGGVLYGILKEINLKNYSAKVQISMSNKLETFFFDKMKWEDVRDALESKVEVRFEGSGFNKKMIELKKIKSYQDKQKMTGKDILQSNIIGLMKDREDITDSVSYAKDLGDSAFHDG